MSVYSPSGSGNVHVDTVMGGGKRVAATPKAKRKAQPKRGMGFQAAASSAAKSAGVSPKQGAAIVAAASRSASPAAKAANSNLKKVPAKKKAATATKRGGKK